MDTTCKSPEKGHIWGQNWGMGENWSMGVYENNVVNLCFLKHSRFIHHIFLFIIFFSGKPMDMICF